MLFWDLLSSLYICYIIRKFLPHLNTLKRLNIKLVVIQEKLIWHKVATFESSFLIFLKMIFNKTADTTCFTKEAKCETLRKMRIQRVSRGAIHHKVLLGVTSSDDWLALSDQPLKSLLAALPLHLCSNHVTALPVVLIHPVTLQDREEGSWSLEETVVK